VNTTGLTMKFFSLSGHMHKRGVRFTTYRSNGTELYDNYDWAPPLKVLYDPPLELVPGDWFDYECLEDNGVNRTVKRDSLGTPIAVKFGVTTDDEMCILPGSYYTDYSRRVGSPVGGPAVVDRGRLVERVVRALEDAEHRERAVVVDVVEDVVVVDREVVAAADALEQRGARGERIVGEPDDRFADQAQRALGDQLQLAIRAVRDVQLRRHLGLEGLSADP